VNMELMYIVVVFLLIMIKGIFET